MTSTLWIVGWCVLCVLFQFHRSLASVIEYQLDKFPKHLVALHMPCEESNMFATKCMCHIKCEDPNCLNAKKICEKYEKDKGCKYVLIRGTSRKIATLKRTPLPWELASFNISMYPTTKEDLAVSSYSKLSYDERRVSLRSLVDSSGSSVKTTLSELQKKVDKKYCGKNDLNIGNSSSISAFSRLFSSPSLSFLDGGISLVALSYHAPRTFVNSIRSWNQSGLLSLMDENIALLNDPFSSEIAMAKEYGLRVIQPQDIKNAKTNKRNVFTIGAAFFYALQFIRNEYLLFLENDFKMDTSLSRDEIISELIAAVGMLEKGAEVVRLQSRKYQGCGTFKSCDHGGIHLDASDMMERRRNWFAFYCKNWKGTEKWVDDCLEKPYYRCFTSWDSNWTLNAVLVKKSTMMNKKYSTSSGMKSIAEIGGDTFRQQDGFESTMSYGVKWMAWKVPVCISYEGLFLHEEIETGH